MLPRLDLSALAVIALLCATVSAHSNIIYPGWRGNNLKDDMQWRYPCGGLGVTTNRTKWPITGGSISLVPGEYSTGHPSSFWYINMGYGNDPPNMTNIMHPVFQTTGPTKNEYPGQFCVTQVPLPANNTLKVGDNATIQVIQVALHGGDLYNCADVTLVEPEDADPIPDGDCTNSTDIGFNLVYTTTSSGDRQHAFYSVGAAVLVGMAVFMTTMV